MPRIRFAKNRSGGEQNVRVERGLSACKVSGSFAFFRIHADAVDPSIGSSRTGWIRLDPLDPCVTRAEGQNCSSAVDAIPCELRKNFLSSSARAETTSAGCRWAMAVAWQHEA